MLNALAFRICSLGSSYSGKCSRVRALNTVVVLPQVPHLASTTSKGRPRTYDCKDMVNIFGGKHVLLAWQTRKTVEEPLQRVRSAGPFAAAAGTNITGLPAAG